MYRRLLPAALLVMASAAAQPLDPRVQCEQWAEEDGVTAVERDGYLADCIASLEGEWPDNPEDAGRPADEDAAEEPWPEDTE